MTNRQTNCRKDETEYDFFPEAPNVDKSRTVMTAKVRLEKLKQTVQLNAQQMWHSLHKNLHV